MAEASGNPTLSLAYRRHRRSAALPLLSFYFRSRPVQVWRQFRHVPRIDSFVPAIAAIIFVADLITAVLLFSQSAIIASRAILVLANGYLFSALIVIPHTLTFPGAFAPKGLLGAGFQSGGWLNVLWHLGFLVAVAGYACLKGEKYRSDAVPTPVLPAFFQSLAIQISLVCALTSAVTAGDRFMPQLFLDDLSPPPLLYYAAGTLVLISVVVLLLMWRRRTSTLDQWVMVAIGMLISEMALVTFGITSRFYLGWYVSRALAVAVSMVVLIALLAEAMRLHARLANALALLQRAEQLQSDLLDQSLDAIFTWKIGDGITDWNRGAEVLYGYTSEQAIGRSSHHLLWTRSPISMVEVEAQIAREGSWYGELTHTTRDGRKVVVESRMVAVRNEGETYALQISRDITERKAHQEQVQLLLREVDHRAKNILSVVDAIARQTAAISSGDFVERFSERIQALSASHDLLVRNEWKGVDLDDLVRGQLAHFNDLIGSRIAVHGPKLRLNATSAQPIGLALHELATNASKYGALSTDKGRVLINWGVSGNTFNMSWTERGGPPVSAPKRRGFGITVLEGMVEHSLGGTVDLDFASSGLIWRLTSPTENGLESRESSSIVLELVTERLSMARRNIATVNATLLVSANSSLGWNVVVTIRKRRNGCLLCSGNFRNFESPIVIGWKKRLPKFQIEPLPKVWLVARSRSGDHGIV